MDEDNEPNEEGFSVTFWVMLFVGIVGVLGFVFAAGGAALGG